MLPLSLTIPFQWLSLQMPTTTADSISHEAETKFVRIIDLATQGQGVWIMIILLLLGSVAAYIFAERLVTIKKASRIPKNFMSNIKEYICEGKANEAIKLCEYENTPGARMIQKGISRIGRPLNDVNSAIENVGNIEIAHLEKGLTTLATISGGAPMIGFLGTVLGMIEAFMNIANAGNNVDVSQLASGIYTAMTTTVGGLIVGILAYFAYNYLTARIDNTVQKMERASMEFMDLLNEPQNKSENVS